MPSPTAKREQRRRVILENLDGLGGFDRRWIKYRDFIDRSLFRLACADAIIRYQDSVESRKSKTPGKRDTLRDAERISGKQLLTWEWIFFDEPKAKRRHKIRQLGGGWKEVTDSYAWEPERLILDVVGLFWVSTLPRYPTRRRLFDSYLPCFLKAAHPRLEMSGSAVEKSFTRAGGIQIAQLWITHSVVPPNLGFPASEWPQILRTILPQ